MFILRTFSMNTMLLLAASMMMMPPLASAEQGNYLTEQRFLNENPFSSFLAWSPDGSRIAACANIDIVILNSTDGKVLNKITLSPLGVKGICWSPDGKQLASISSEKAVRIWDASDCTEVLKANVTDGSPSSVAWSPDGTRIAARVGERAISILSAANGSKLLSIPLEQSIAGKGGLRWSPDGSKLLDVGINHVFVFNSTNGTMVTDICASTSVASADWAPSGENIAVSIHDATLATYNASTAERLNPPPNNLSQLVQEVAIAWSPSGSRIATLGHSGTLRFWDGEGAPVQSIDLTPSDYGAGLSWSPDGYRLASAYCGEIRIWGTTGPSIVASLEASPNITTSGEPANLTIQVTDINGSPLEGGELMFFSNLGSYSPVTYVGNGTYHALFTPDWMLQDIKNQAIFVMVRKEGVGSAVASCLVSINGRPAPPINNTPPVFINISAANGSSFVSSRPVNITAKVYDADGDNLAIVWYVNHTKTAGSVYSGFLEVGNYTIKVLVTDGYGNTETSFNISVVGDSSSHDSNNTTQPNPPTNHAPVIHNATLLDGMRVKAATVLLSVSSSDLDGDNLTYRWTVDGTVVGTGRDLGYKFIPGNHTVTIDVSDGKNVTTQTYRITVERTSSPSTPAAIPGIGLAGVLCAVCIIIMLRLRRTAR